MENGQNLPATLFCCRSNAPTPAPKKNAVSSPAEGKETGKSSGRPSRVRARLFRARLKTIQYSNLYNRPQQGRRGHQRHQRNSRRGSTEEQTPDHQPETLTIKKEHWRGEGRGVARRPMFRADRLTAGDHRRRQADQLHAPDIQQTADTIAGNSPDQAREMRTGQNVP